MEWFARPIHITRAQNSSKPWRLLLVGLYDNVPQFAVYFLDAANVVILDNVVALWIDRSRPAWAVPLVPQNGLNSGIAVERFAGLRLGHFVEDLHAVISGDRIRSQNRILKLRCQLLPKCCVLGIL